MKNNNYVEKYKDYYGIDFDSQEYEVHHIDFNHSNNDIENLMLLPKKLHRRYHYYARECGFDKDVDYKTHIEIGVKADDAYWNSDERQVKATIEFFKVLQEVRDWYKSKLSLEGIEPCENEHNE